MLRGCLLALLLYAALAFGYFFWLNTVFDYPGNIYGALALGFVVLLCLGALMNARTAFKDWSLLASAERGQPPRDGKLCAVAGKIYPVGQPLIAPFSGEECVLCEYDMSRQRRHVGTTSQENTGSDFAGFLMVPSVVRSQQAEVRILGFPIVEGASEKVASNYASARRAIDYLTTHEFESRTGVKIVTVLGVFEDVWSDEDGLVEKNIRLGTVSLPDLFPPELEAAIDREMQLATEQGAGAQFAAQGEDDLLDREDERLDRIEALDPSEDEEEDEDDFEDDDDFEDEDGELSGASAAKIPRMTEKRIAVGTQVCAIGVYNEMKRGLAPPGRGRQPNRLFCGSAAKLTKVFQSKFRSHLAGGLVFLTIAHLATFGAMQVYLHSDATARDRATAAFEAANKQDFNRLGGLLRRGMDINIRNTSGATLLMEAKEPAVASWLIEHGIDVNAKDSQGRTALMAAVEARRPEIVRQLIAAKADLDVRDTEYNRSALMKADSRHFDEIAELLRQAGAKDDVITAASGEPLPEDGGEPLALVKQYLAAVHARDPSTLAQLFVTGKNINFNDTDWDLWHSCRPIELAEWTGFVRGDDASIKVSGVTGGGYTARWRYQLRRDAGQWKITREEDDL
jgi:Ankyrin repeats (3 copies)